MDKYLDNMLSGDGDGDLDFASEEHREIAKRYNQVRKKIDGVKEETRKTDIQAVRTLSRFMGDKPFTEATVDDIMQWTEWLEEHYKESSQATFKTRIRIFYKWLANQEDYEKGKKYRKLLDYPECVQWISIKQSNNELPTDYVLSPSDIKDMVEVCDNVRDQAMLMTLYEGGFRATELTNLLVKNLTFDKYGAKIVLHKGASGQKTGMRKIWVKNAVPYLHQLMNSHPFGDYPDAPLFYSRNQNHYHRLVRKAKNGGLTEQDMETLTLSRRSLWEIVTAKSEQAGIKTNVYPHLFRHSRAYWFAKKGFNEEEMRKFFGWSKRSEMPSHYTTLASVDIENKLKQVYGIKEVEEEIEKEDKALEAQVCPRCQYENEATARYCMRCGMALSLEAAQEAEDEDRQMVMAMDELLQQPEIKDKIFEAFKNIIQEIEEERS